MHSGDETTAMVALLRSGRRGWAAYQSADDQTSAAAILESQLGLLVTAALDEAEREIAGWAERRIGIVSVTDSEYPGNLRRVVGRPPLLFVSGELVAADQRSVAIVGTRRASEHGRHSAHALAARLAGEGYTVVSGLAAGIDGAAHAAALDAGGRTVAVIGTGLDHCYPAQNEPLQRRIAAEGAVVSQFWPETPPTRKTFPMRNAVMAGMTIATMIVEASCTSGTRIQARMALAAGRRVLLTASLMEQQWARELAARPGVHVVRSQTEALAVLAAIDDSEPARLAAGTTGTLA